MFYQSSNPANLAKEEKTIEFEFRLHLLYDSYIWASQKWVLHIVLVFIGVLLFPLIKQPNQLVLELTKYQI